MAETLREQIEKLNELHGRLQRVRQIPRELLHSAMASGTENEFAALKEIGGVMLSEPVQVALHRARESLKADGSGIGMEHRRENRKRRRSRAGSPEGYVDRKRTPLPASGSVKMENLGEWAQAYNETHTNKIRIRGQLLRLAMADVMTVYMGIGIGEDGCVVVETIRVFGPREQTTGHGESRYAVFQQLSQQLGKMLEGGGGLAGVTGVVDGYSDLFVRACRVCGRVVGNEGHVPAVVRVWTSEGWAAEHLGCWSNL